MGGIKMNVKDKVKNLPSHPGVYLMKDSLGRIIYVGKAKNLKNRVSTYFQNSKAHHQKIKKLKANIADFTYIPTDTEFEAFMLECKLIKEFKPLFNKMMKNPQSYVYIRIQMEGNFPRIEIVTSEKDEKAYYFGPFSSRRTVEGAILGIKDFYKINCSQPYNLNAPCLNYSLGLCLGICFKEEAVEQYKRIINKIIALLSGTDMSIIDEINQQMIEAAKNSKFEIAAKYRDNLDLIHALINKEKVIEFTEANQNIVILENLNASILKLFLIKGNKVLFSKKYNQMDKDINQLMPAMKEHILSCFGDDPWNTKVKVSKDTLDETRIIYSYLKGSNSIYKLIPKKWLKLGQTERIDEAIRNMLEKVNTRAEKA